MRAAPTLAGSMAPPTIAFLALLTLTFLLRIPGLDQPIVENYVGRQIPTAMVARNLDRGTGFLRPSLDVAPFPNLFLVEPPIYATLVVALKRVTHLPLEPSGRLVSALGITLAAWGLFGLVRSREGDLVALAAVAIFAFLPVTLRYGRGFQPDALMLGCLLAGVRLCDDSQASKNHFHLLAGLTLISLALALKIVSAYILIPLVFILIPGLRLLPLLTLLPAFLWYAHAAPLLAGGSRASADNQAVWLNVLIPSALLHFETYQNITRFLFVRSFTPLGPPLALLGFFALKKPTDRLWRIWGASAFFAMLALSAKLHHEYYWLSLAPLIAFGIARFLVSLARQGTQAKLLATLLTFAFIVLSFSFSASTWKTPEEWKALRAAASAIQAAVPADALLVAPEALLYSSDRRGCRLEFTPSAARRAAGEWNLRSDVGTPLRLVDFYRSQGARFFADLQPAASSPDRVALHDAVRRRYNVLSDVKGVVLIAELNEPHQGADHASEGPLHRP